jgi:hypothetical protein
MGLHAALLRAEQGRRLAEEAPLPALERFEGKEPTVSPWDSILPLAISTLASGHARVPAATQPSPAD